METTFNDGRKRLVVIEWDANGSTDPDEWDECDAGAYEFADAATPEELHAAVCGAKEEALDLLHANGAGWVSILVGPGETEDASDYLARYAEKHAEKHGERFAPYYGLAW